VKLNERAFSILSRAVVTRVARVYDYIYESERPNRLRAKEVAVSNREVDAHEIEPNDRHPKVFEVFDWEYFERGPEARRVRIVK